MSGILSVLGQMKAGQSAGECLSAEDWKNIVVGCKKELTFSAVSFVGKGRISARKYSSDNLGLFVSSDLDIAEDDEIGIDLDDTSEVFDVVKVGEASQGERQVWLDGGRHLADRAGDVDISIPAYCGHWLLQVKSRTSFFAVPDTFSVVAGKPVVDVGKYSLGVGDMVRIPGAGISAVVIETLADGRSLLGPADLGHDRSIALRSGTFDASVSLADVVEIDAVYEGEQWQVTLSFAPASSLFEDFFPGDDVVGLFSVEAIVPSMLEGRLLMPRKKLADGMIVSRSGSDDYRLDSHRVSFGELGASSVLSDVLFGDTKLKSGEVYRVDGSNRSAIKAGKISLDLPTSPECGDSVVVQVSSDVSVPVSFCCAGIPVRSIPSGSLVGLSFSDGQWSSFV